LRVTTGAAANGAPAPTAIAPIGIITGELGARVLEPLVPRSATAPAPEVRLVPVANRSSAATSVSPVCSPAPTSRPRSPGSPRGHRYLLPDVVLSRGKFLDGETVAVLPRPVEIVATDGAALVRALTPLTPDTS
jgi:hypothetical protein